MWQGHRVSVVFPAYNEQAGIAAAVTDFGSLDAVDDVLVIDNNSQDETAPRAEAAGARVVREPRQGYGNALRRGLATAQGEYIVLAEPDGTFIGKDVLKLLAYADDFDLVLGTRTTRELIWHGANMAWLLRWGNWAVAKLIEALFNTSHLSDVGCTYRLLRREMADHVAAAMKVGGNHAGAEIMLLTVVSGARFVEVPVNYLPRVGVSSVTGDPRAAVGVGLRMIGLVLAFRRRADRRPARPAALVAPTAATDDDETREPLAL
jgi:glycosyltransferase involved in cell wall biosynthesis